MLQQCTLCLNSMNAVVKPALNSLENLGTNGQQDMSCRIEILFGKSRYFILFCSLLSLFLSFKERSFSMNRFVFK